MKARIIKTRTNSNHNDWEEFDFEDSLTDNGISRSNQIPSSEIKTKGKFPVIDQGQDFIAGYSNESKKLFHPPTPVVIFGDHTRIFKYIDFPFIIGADGTKVLRPDPELFDPKYFYLVCLTLNIQSRGYNRHYKLLKEKKIIKPPRDYQIKVSNIFTVLEDKIRVSKLNLTLHEEFYKSLLLKVIDRDIDISKI